MGCSHQCFIERFKIGFLGFDLSLGLSSVFNGLIMGFGPWAIITRAYVPILIVGVVGGLVVGYIAQAVLGP